MLNYLIELVEVKGVEPLSLQLKIINLFIGLGCY